MALFAWASVPQKRLTLPTLLKTRYFANKRLGAMREKIELVDCMFCQYREPL